MLEILFVLGFFFMLMLTGISLLGMIAALIVAFSPVTDDLAVRNLLLPLLAAAVFVPYFKRSLRVKETFTE